MVRVSIVAKTLMYSRGVGKTSGRVAITFVRRGCWRGPQYTRKFG
jgi:hypothetical protein